MNAKSILHLLIVCIGKAPSDARPQETPTQKIHQEISKYSIL